MSLSLKKVEELAPDQASLNAAGKLIKPAKWPLLARETQRNLLWGECQGSGSNPYRLSVDLSDLGYRCSCPSRKFPCKHILALLWQYAESEERFQDASAPDWVEDWLGRRRPKAAGDKAKPAGGDATGKASLRAARKEEDSPEKTAKDEARAAAQRERLRRQREESILLGLEELDRWIADQLDRGIAAFAQSAVQQCRLAAQRLVDAKASGVASALDQLPAALFALPEDLRHDFLIERLGGLYLLSQAYRNQDALPPELREDVRRLIGWSTRREDLLAAPSAPRAKGRWFVLATRSENQADNLRRIETWMWRAAAPDAEASGDAPEFAVLMDFVPLSAGATAAPFTPGEYFEAELVFYPSAAPLRAVIAERGQGEGSGPWPRPRHGLPEAVGRHFEALARQPWLSSAPITASETRLLADSHDQLFLADREQEILLRLDPGQREDALPLLGLDGLAVAGLWDGRFLQLLTADTPLGRWLPA